MSYSAFLLVPADRSSGLHAVVNVLGGHPLLGVLAVLVTCVAFFTLEFLRLTGARRWSSYSSIIKRIAVIALILSVALMLSRFAAVEGL